jgi:hypothetical protein
VLGVSRADDANHALALDHLAVLTDWLDAAAYFHKKAPMDVQIPRGPFYGLGAFRKFSELAFENTEAVEASQLTERQQLGRPETGRKRHRRTLPRNRVFSPPPPVER